MTTLSIDKEIESLLPPLTKEELAALEVSLQEDGCRDSLVVWKETGFLLEGHNRYHLCQKHGIKYTTLFMKFPSRNLAIQWVIDNQLGRRNLSDTHRAYFIGKEYLHKKKAEGQPKGKEVLGHSDIVLGETSKALADKHDISPRTVTRDAEFAEAVDTLEEQAPGSRAAILEGAEPRKAVIARARPKVAPKPKPTAPQNGQVFYDDRKIDSLIGKLIREIDQRGAIHGKFKEYQGCVNDMESLVDHWAKWRKAK